MRLTRVIPSSQRFALGGVSALRWFSLCSLFLSLLFLRLLPSLARLSAFGASLTVRLLDSWPRFGLPICLLSSRFSGRVWWAIRFTSAVSLLGLGGSRCRCQWLLLAGRLFYPVPSVASAFGAVWLRSGLGLRPLFLLVE